LFTKIICYGLGGTLNNLPQHVCGMRKTAQFCFGYDHVFASQPVAVSAFPIATLMTPTISLIDLFH